MTTETLTRRPDIEPGTWVLDVNHSRIEFVAKHLMVTKVRGHFQTYDAKIEVGEDLTDSKVEVVFHAASITTGVEDRDQHLRSNDFLDLERHPTVEFVSTRIEGSVDDWKVFGDLKIRGVSRPIVLDATYEGTAVDPWGNTHVGFRASTTIDREDWGLTWNTALDGGGWLVSKEVKIEIEGQLIRP